MTKTFLTLALAAAITGCTGVRVGKRAAGRELDGRTWDEFPEVTR